MRRFCAVVVSVALMVAPVLGEETVNLDVVNRIRQEASNNSKVMDTLFQLTDVHGPRVTNSPSFFKAAEWAAKQLNDWGIPAKLESWGPYGRGWEYTYFSAHMTEPEYAPLIGFPMAYSKGTNGVVSGEVSIAVINVEADFAKYKGKLKGKIVMLGTGRVLTLSTDPLALRRSEDNLRTLEQAPEAVVPQRPPGATAAEANGRGNNNPGAAPVGEENAAQPPAETFQQKLVKFLVDENPALVIRMGGGRSEGGTVFAQGGSTRDMKDPVAPPMIALTPEHYNRMARLLDKGVAVKVQVEVRARVLEDRQDSINIIAELPGNRKKDEIVMLGAHFDSWQGGTGATDNAVGSAVMMEAMRILKALNLPLERTVRLGLWSGEEQGLLGSRAYVTEHFARRADARKKEELLIKPAHAKLSGYFNVDNGAGKIRGVYLQGNDMMRPVFEAWLKPFADQGVGTLSIRNTAGTDHLAFDEVGLPGFQFIQDQLEYDSRTHHSNMDVLDRVQRADAIQMAGIVAAVVYHAANREDLLPRKELPKPLPRPGQR